MPPTSLPRHRGGNVSLSHGSGNLHLSGQEEELTGIAHHAMERTAQDFKRGLKSFNENANTLKLICHNATILELKRRHSKVPTVFSPKQTRPNTTAKYQSPQPSPFSGHFLWGPFCVRGRVTPQPSSSSPGPSHKGHEKRQLRCGQDQSKSQETPRRRRRRHREQHSCGDDGDAHIFYRGPAMVPSMVPMPVAQLL